MRNKSPVVVIGTGGTVSFAGRDSLDLYGYVDHGRRQEVAEILAQFPETRRGRDKRRFRRQKDTPRAPI